MGVKKIKIVHLYPKELSLYGDSGNILCIVKRLEERGYKTDVKNIGIGDTVSDFDLMFIGGGQDKEMKIISRDLRKKGDMLRYAVNSGKTLLAICGGFQLLGEHYKTTDGDILHLSSALPFYTVGGEKRMIGNIVFKTPFGTAAGFENHSGKTYLNGLEPLGKVISGFGNNGEDETEGLLFKNTFCTYAHGPVLPKNARLADEILKRATGDELSPIDDELENRCNLQLIHRFK